MTKLAKLEFMALDITGKNYLSWVLDAEIHLNANNLGETIKEVNKANTQDKAKAMIFLRHHIQGSTCPLDQSERKEMLEKTFLKFHPSNVILQQQYRERGFTKYSELISCLLVAEQNNELLMKNHETRPVGATPIPEANVATYNGQSESYTHGRGYHRGRGRGHGCGRGHGRGRGRRNYHSVQFKNKGTCQRWHNNENKSSDEKNKKKVGSSLNACYRCGSNNHWSKTCRTAKHLVELYQQSIKDKANGIETNFTYEVANVDVTNGHKDHNDTTNLDYDDFLIEPTNLDSGDIVADTTQLDACNFPNI
ncbi:uncharacterized protein LOC110906875 [Helianthus annuus]|uniref:uncharacterized protein LOC110906875 n=1 Tax=Helianthus annuus TaxID=4232 RepID=UPI001652E614|nr:uncharacterized protein LOC110906875 [Helianthus annuus]